ncbi:hypothetical protein GUJ93_ZPchr0006g42424 [Zizania palustris]|uniref:Uncharacterized protein n=1 Tax=Zizania palustris TaxID=103762 RepID=A0A8J5SYM3_ZIZPA|nr:hypothetical protein GUJ93_ZPchr0006g42424 [Zizania palustris]
MVKRRLGEASRGRRLDAGFARWLEAPRTHSSHPVFARWETREGIRALAGVAALALRPVHTRAVATTRLGAGSAKAGWAWRRWRVWRRRRKRWLRKLGLGVARAAGGERARNGPRRRAGLLGRGGEGGALRAVEAGREARYARYMRTDDHCPL